MDYKILIDAFFKERSLVDHHIKSFNQFVDRKLQEIVNEVGSVKIEPLDIELRFGRIWLGKPSIREADGETREIYPMEARLRDITYASPIHLEVSVCRGEIEEEHEEVVIGKLPIMVKSKVCHLYKLPRRRLVELGEDPDDPGGYFIINGTERVLVLVEDLASNRIMVEEAKTGTGYVAKVFSARGWYRRPVSVIRRGEGELFVNFPPLTKEIPFVVVMKALGLEKDVDIVNAVSQDLEIQAELYLQLEEFAEIEDRIEAIDYIGRRVAIGQPKDQRIARAEQLLDNALLPHMGATPGDRIAKAYFLGRMAEKVIKLVQGKISPDDKDHYANKRLRLAGDLLEDLFRVAFRGLVANTVYFFEKVSRREREIGLRTAIRSSFLTERIEHAMATGEWVGGRQGISQHLDRQNIMSFLSHLRRVRSLLSKTQPHFEARDLHATHFGKLCPNETPEGSNIGLIKNLSILAEVTTGVNERYVQNILFKLGVKPLQK